MPKKLTYVESAASGLKMEEGAARALDAAVKEAPADAQYQRRAVADVIDSMDVGQREEVSIINTDALDRQREVVLPSGMDVRNYNGVVTFAHSYDELPVGRALWVKQTAKGVVAKTRYATRPPDWTDEWMPDAIVHMLSQDPPMCTGKSIGFLPMSWREVNEEDVRARPELIDCYAICDKWKLIEYAVAPVPCNPEAELIQMGKSKGIGEGAIRKLFEVAKVLGLKTPEPKTQKQAEPPALPKLGAFITADAVKAARREHLKATLQQQVKSIPDMVNRELREAMYDLIGKP